MYVYIYIYIYIYGLHISGSWRVHAMLDQLLQQLGHVELAVESLSTMKETQTQRAFHLDNNKTYVKHIVPSSFSFSDLWVWVSWIVLKASSST